MKRLWALAIVAFLISSAPAAASTASLASPSATVTVNATNALEFVPPVVIINVGDTVMWQNTGTLFHTVTSDTNFWPSASLPAGGTFSFTFTQAGTYTYHCVPHLSAGMIGTVVVGAINTNGSFETDANGDGTPDGWTRLNLAAGDTLVNDANSGTKGFRINGAAGVTKVLYQRRTISGSAGDKVTIHGWSEASGASSTGGFYGILLRFENTDGTTSQSGVQFTKGTHDWERKTMTLTASKPYNAIILAAVYQNQTGNATFDDVTATRP